MKAMHPYAYIGTIVLALVTIVLITRERDRLADELLARPTMDRIVIWKDFTVDGEPLVCFEAVKTYRDIDTAFHGLCDDLTCDFPDTVGARIFYHVGGIAGGSPDSTRVIEWPPEGGR